MIAPYETYVLHDSQGLNTSDVPGHDTVLTQFFLQFTQKTVLPLQEKTLYVLYLQLPSKVMPLLILVIKLEII